MQAWKPLRNSTWSDGFGASLAAAGLTWQGFDEIAPSVDAVLLGVSEAALDSEYPPIRSGYRLFLVAASRGLPALRIAFRVDGPTGSVCYEAVSLRESEAEL